MTNIKDEMFKALLHDGVLAIIIYLLIDQISKKLDYIILLLK